MANHLAMRASLNEFLAEHADSCILHRKRVRTQIQNVVNPILEGVRLEDPTLDVEPLDDASFFLSLKSRHVYEVNMNLRGLQTGDFSIEDGQTSPGYALVKLQSQHTKAEWRRFCSRCSPEKMFLNAKTVSERLLERVKAVLKRSSLIDGLENVKVHEDLVDNAIVLQLDNKNDKACLVMLTPAISCKRWIPSANAWLAEHSHWPNKKLKQETAELDGIVLVGKSALKKSAYQWRVTFPMPTRRLVQADMGCRNKCLSAIEIILDNARYVPRGVDQCHFKTLILHLNKKYPVPEFWAEDKFGQRFTDLLLYLQRCLIGRRLDDFFVPEINMFEGLEETTFKFWELQVKDFLQDIGRYLREFRDLLETTAL